MPIRYDDPVGYVIKPIKDKDGRVLDPPRVRCEGMTIKGARCFGMAEFKLRSHLVCFTHRHGASGPVSHAK